MDRNQVQKYLIPEVTIKLMGDGGDAVCTLSGDDVPAIVTFDYDGGSSDGIDLPSLHNVVVRCSGGSTVGAHRLNMEIEDGFDLTPFLSSPQMDKIEEFVLARMAEQDRVEADENRKDAARRNHLDRRESCFDNY